MFVCSQNITIEHPNHISLSHEKLVGCTQNSMEDLAEFNDLQLYLTWHQCGHAGDKFLPEEIMVKGKLILLVMQFMSC